MICLSPSLLSLDFYRAKEQLSETKNFSPYLHFDIMDGHFVPNLALGECIVKSLRNRTDQIFDVHLMVEDPDFFAEPFLKAGADILTFHLESRADPKKLIDKIHAHGKKAGLSIKPQTPIEALFPYLGDIDLALVMTVEPGFGGQALIASCLKKIAVLREKLDEMGRDILLEADGGIKADNVREVTRRGANLIVAGSAIFAQDDPARAAEELLRAARDI